MLSGKCLDGLILGAWRIMGSRSESEVFEPWKEHCLKCLSLLMGADHHYTHCFKSYVQHPDSLSLLAAGGLLEAAREEFQRVGSGHVSRSQGSGLC
jgi:hypothetical protein